jgi:hypothetical protein
MLICRRNSYEIESERLGRTQWTKKCAGVRNLSFSNLREVDNKPRILCAVHISNIIQQMGRRNQSDEATFTDNSKSARNAKSNEPATYRLAPHSKSRVAYFHDEGVGNYHYGVSSRSSTDVFQSAHITCFR